MQLHHKIEAIVMLGASVFSFANANLIGTISGILTIVYVSLRIYYLVKSNGKIKGDKE